MRLGCDLPYFSDPSEIRAFAQAVEEIGYDHIGFSEHVAGSRATEYPSFFTYSDPWHETFTLLGFLAAVTERITLSSAMLLATLRSPVLVAKQAAEIDVLSKQRLRLGLSVGWNREEQVALGVDPSTRGARLDEMVPVLRRLWTEDEVTHDGEHYALDRVGLHPAPGRAIPIWMGGGGLENGGQPPEVSLRRAARLADGFKLMAPTGTDVDRALSIAEHLLELAESEGRVVEIEARLLTQVTPAGGLARGRAALPGVRAHHASRARQPHRWRHRGGPDRSRRRRRAPHPTRALTGHTCRVSDRSMIVDFERHPDRYRHWKLSVDGAIATLTMAVDPEGGLADGYELKLNSYDLGVDIELADAVQRLRFEHPEVHVVV